MAYGIDQCRICGAPIRPKGPEAAEEQEKANRKCLMPEKEWRRRGFLAPPTRKQIYTDPSNGCCPKCGMMVLKTYSKFGLRTGLTALLFICLALFLVFIITFLPH